MGVVMRRAAIVLAAGLLASACATTRAQTPIERPGLNVPPAPPRIIEPAPPPENVGIEPVPDVPFAAEEPKPPLPARTKPAVTAAAKEPQKPEVKPDAPAADPAVGGQTQNTPAVPLLRTPATVDTVAAERQIRATLDSARKGLDSVDYQRLSEPRQRWFKEANDFIVGAEAALKASDFELGKDLADKAEKYARELLR